MLLPLYLGCLALGGTLVLASILLGGGHHFDHGVGDHAAGNVHVHVDKDAGLRVQVGSHELPVDKAADFLKELPAAKDFPVDKALDLVKDIVKDVPHDAAPSPDAAQTPIDQTVGPMHPTSGGDLGGLGWRAIMSLRFWTFGLAAFGFLGSFLSVAGLHEPVVALVSAPTGLVLGYVAAWIFWKLSKSEVTAMTGLQGLRGTEGDVVLPIRLGGTGKIGLKMSGQYTELPARTNDGREMAMRERVLVVSIEDGIATVTSVKARRS